MRRLLSASLALLAALGSTFAADAWPHLRGPDAVSAQAPAEWVGSGSPVIAWTTDIGVGYSAVVWQGELAITSGNFDGTGSKVIALALADGSERWTFAYEEKQQKVEKFAYEGGPNATPTIAGDAVYMLSRNGMLFCLGLSDGAERWRFNAHGEIKNKRPGFGYASSPLVLDGQVIVAAGSRCVSVDVATGKEKWRAGKADSATFSSPFYLPKHKTLALFARDGLVGMDPTNGKDHWLVAWKTKYRNNMGQPLPLDDSRIFVSSGYGTGSGLVTLENNEWSVAWTQANVQLQQTSAVFVDGFLYGVDADFSKPGDLVCIDPADGRVCWRKPGFGAGTLVAAGKVLLVISDTGALVHVDADGKEYRERHRLQLTKGQYWQQPSLAPKRLLTRSSQGSLVAVDLP